MSYIITNNFQSPLTVTDGSGTYIVGVGNTVTKSIGASNPYYSAITFSAANVPTETGAIVDQAIYIAQNAQMYIGIPVTLVQGPGTVGSWYNVINLTSNPLTITDGTNTFVAINGVNQGRKSQVAVVKANYLGVDYQIPVGVEFTIRTDNTSNIPYGVMSFNQWMQTVSSKQTRSVDMTKNNSMFLTWLLVILVVLIIIVIVIELNNRKY